MIHSSILIILNILLIVKTQTLIDNIALSFIIQDEIVNLDLKVFTDVFKYIPITSFSVNLNKNINQIVCII